MHRRVPRWRGQRAMGGTLGASHPPVAPDHYKVLVTLARIKNIFINGHHGVRRERAEVDLASHGYDL